MVIGGTNNFNAISNIDIVNPQDEEFNCNSSDYPYRVYGHASTYVPSLQGTVTCGGYNENGNRHTMCFIQRKGGALTQLANMNTARVEFGMVSNGDQIFAIGGYGGWWNMETFNTNNGQWIEEELPFKVRMHCVVTIVRWIVVTGGVDLHGKVSKCNSKIIRPKIYTNASSAKMKTVLLYLFS